MYPLWENLNKLKACRWVELSHSMNNDSPYWAGIPDGSVKIGKVVYDWGNPMLDCLIQTFLFPGQFVKDAPGSDSYGVQNMMYPLCVIDITKQVAEDVHYAVTADDIKTYEAQYGPIPDGAFVALRTDWSDMNAFSNLDEDGGEHCPGWSMEALKYIYEERNAAANGHETLDTDASMVAAEAGDLACERYVLASGKLQIEVLRNLDQVPAAGAILIAAWPRLEGATGLPVRVWAICP